MYALLVLQLAEPIVTLTTVTRSDLESVRLSLSAQCLGAGVSFRPK